MSQEIKSKIKDLERLEKEYSEESTKFYENNKKIENFLKAIVSTEKLCLICGYQVNGHYMNIGNHSEFIEHDDEDHKAIAGFKNTIVEQYEPNFSNRANEILVSGNDNNYQYRETIVIRNYELCFHSNYTCRYTPIIEAWNEFMVGSDGTKWYPKRDKIRRLFEGENMKKLFENIKDGITINLEYTKKDNKEVKNTLDTLDKIIGALGDLN